MSTINPTAKAIDGSDLLPTAAAAATLLRLTLAAFWIVHWWFKVGGIRL